MTIPRFGECFHEYSQIVNMEEHLSVESSNLYQAHFEISRPFLGVRLISRCAH